MNEKMLSCVRLFLFLVFIFLIPSISFASEISSDDLFSHCDKFESDENYPLLYQQFTENERIVDLCLRLNSREYVYTTGDNFKYCKLIDGKSLSCESDIENTWYPDLRPEKSFAGENGKKFVLFKTERLAQGIFGSAYHVFFLVPKKISSRGYSIFSFPDSSSSDQHDGSGKCAIEDGVDPNYDIVTVSLNPPYEIINEAKDNVSIRFNKEVTNCKTGEKFLSTDEYVWRKFSFKKTKELLKKIE
jgi:hypothetical protein